MMNKLELIRTLKITISKNVIENNLNDYLYTRKIDGFDNCCDLIWHLKINYLKDLDDDILYDIAVIVEQQYFDNKINWLNTFTVVEKENYAKQWRNNDDDDVEINVFEDAEAAINLNEEIDDELSNQTLRTSIQEVVFNKLQEKKLI